MEADWEFEVGGDAPVIDACWSGFVDLQQFPERARNLPEVADLPELAVTLERLNGGHSAVWTSKCDYWAVLQPEDFDPGELDALPGSSTHAVGCYIDVLPRSGQRWPSPTVAAAACKHLCTDLRAVPLRCCRVDLIIRRALSAHGVMELGITAYFTACGEGPSPAKAVLGVALEVFADVLCPHSTVQ